MSDTRIHKSTLKSLISELLDSQYDFDVQDAVNVNPVVDPSAAVTDPMNPKFVPQDASEFGVAINSLVKSLPVESIPKVYKTLKDVLKSKEIDVNDRDDKMTQSKNNKTVEESIRAAVRKILIEMNPNLNVKNENDDEDNAPKPKRGRTKAYKDTALGGVSSVGGKSFEEIAQELGLSTAGAKRAVDMAVSKLRWLVGHGIENLEILVLNAVNDYIEMLAETGELTPADVQLMKDHPQLIRELDGFREYLATVIKRERRKEEKEKRGHEVDDDGD